MDPSATIRPNSRDTDHWIAQVRVRTGGVVLGVKWTFGPIVGVRHLKNECVNERCRSMRIEIKRVFGPGLFIRGCWGVNAESRDGLFHPLGMRRDVVHRSVH